MRPTTPRVLVQLVIAVMLAAAPLAAQEQPSEDQAPAAAGTAQEAPLRLHGPVVDPAPSGLADRSFTLSLDDILLTDESHAETLKLAIWDSPLGRAEYDVWQLQRTLGTGGLPGAGPSFPFAARFTMPDSADSRHLFGNGDRRPWHDLTPREKAAKVTTGIVIAGALYSLFEALDD